MDIHHEYVVPTDIFISVGLNDLDFSLTSSCYLSRLVLCLLLCLSLKIQ
jgi:hypothetical protein